MVQLQSKFVVSYERIFKDTAYAQQTNIDWSELLALSVERDFLSQRLRSLSTHQCLGPFKEICNALFSGCLQILSDVPRSDIRAANALETLLVFTRSMLAKNLSGWEIMEVFSGGVKESDDAFMAFVRCAETILMDEEAPASIRHQMLELVLTFVCGAGQSSPVAYFLRVDLFPSLRLFMTSPETAQYSFEAIVLLSVLANYHKSDAAKLNPYMASISETQDEELKRKIWWAADFALSASVKNYQDILDDSPPTVTSSLVSFVTSLRPDRALASKPVESPRDLFKNGPIEATVILLPIYDFLRMNSSFSSTIIDNLSQEDNASSPPCTLIALFSYLLTHASSASSHRAIAYANLGLNIMLTLAENDDLMEALSQPSKVYLRLCRQRLPDLPILSSSSPPICSFLDCHVLWLRHNLHLNLEASLYLTCITSCQRTLWFLKTRKTRLEYHWTELWKGIIGLLSFISSKLDTLGSISGVSALFQQTVHLLDFTLCSIEHLLPAPRLVHEFVYELIHSSVVLKKLPSVQDRLQPGDPQCADKIAHITAVVGYYEEKVSKSGSKSASGSMRALAKEIEKDGVWGARESSDDELPEPRLTKDTFNFARYLCADTLALMP